MDSFACLLASGGATRRYRVARQTKSQPCRSLSGNAVQLQLHPLAYNLANLMRTLTLPDQLARWSLTTVRAKPVKIGAKVVRHGR